MPHMRSPKYLTGSNKPYPVTGMSREGLLSCRRGHFSCPPLPVQSSDSKATFRIPYFKLPFSHANIPHRYFTFPEYCHGKLSLIRGNPYSSFSQSFIYLYESMISPFFLFVNPGFILPCSYPAFPQFLILIMQDEEPYIRSRKRLLKLPH